MRPADDNPTHLQAAAGWLWRNGLNVAIGVGVLALLDLQAPAR
jgi:hypothetical protein